MSMNAKKLLWISIAACGFVAVVLAAALLLFSPSKDSTKSTLDINGGANQTGSSTQSTISVSSSTTTGQSPSARSGDVYIVYGDNQSTTTTLASASGQTSTTVIVLPTTATPPSSSSSQSSVSQAKAAPAKTTSTTVHAQVPSTATTSKPVAQSPSSPAPKAAQTSAGSYWIQTGSFGSAAVADSLKATLLKHGIEAVVKEKVVNGKNYFQVKAGPYASKSEATKMLGAVKKVPGTSQQAFVTSK